MYTVLNSARYAVRGLIRTPIFALTVVLTLALAISANSAVFSIVDRVLLRPLPFPEADRLAYISHADQTSSLPRAIPPGRLLDWSERNRSPRPVNEGVTYRPRCHAEGGVETELSPGTADVSKYTNLQPEVHMTTVTEHAP